MNTEELRAAARTVSLQAPCDREQYIKENYQVATAEETEIIKNLALKFDDYADKSYENSFLEPCKYNGGFYATHKYR